MRALKLKLFAAVLCLLAVPLSFAKPAWSQAALKKVSVVAVAPTSLFWPLYIAGSRLLQKQRP